MIPIPQPASRACYALILFGALALPALAHPQSTAGDDVIYRLHGTVRNGKTGTPIGRALVESQDRRLAVMTDSEGRFALDLHVPARPTQVGGGSGRSSFMGYNQALFLTAQKPGYLPMDQTSPLLLDDTLSSTDVKLKLMPAASIDGRVSATGTDSAANVRVTLLSHQVGDDGRRTWTQTGGHATNSRGEFHFANLRPGEYTLITSEWRGEQRLPLPQAAPAQQYPPVYLGDGSTLAAATKLQLHHGDADQAEFHLHLATFYPVNVPVALPSSAGPANGVNVLITDPGSGNGYRLAFNLRDGAVTGSLPSGRYALSLSTYGQQPNFASTTITVANAPFHGAPVTLAPAATLNVRVHTQFTSPQPDDSTERIQAANAFRRGRITDDQSAPVAPPLVQLLLRTEDGAGGYTGISRPGSSSDEVVVQNVAPGRYFVRAQPMRGYVAAMTSGGVDLLKDSLTVSPSGAGPIDVTLRDDSATLSGTITYTGDQPQPNSSILLLPTDPAGQFTQGYGGPGQFLVANIAPGTYRVLAFRGAQVRIAYRDPEIMQRYRSKGTLITAAPGQKLRVDLTALDTDPATDAAEDQ